MNILYIVFSFWFGIFSLGSTAAADPDPYMTEVPTKRLALVIGNSQYTHHGNIPSSAADAGVIAKTLAALGFSVTPIENVATSMDFYSDHFKKFLAKIEENDFVVVYYSGHGLAYGEENFLAMTGTGKTMSEAEALDYLVALSDLRGKVKHRKAGVAMFILDACRSLTEVPKIRKGNGEDGDVPKGMVRLGTIQDVIIGFSSEFGTVSKGREDEGKLSYYTEALAARISERDKEFGVIHRDVRADVIANTGEEQTPWVSASASSEIYFNPSKQLIEQEAIAWQAHYRERNWRSIYRFTLRYATSRYVASAKKWLKHNPSATAGVAATSQLAPALVEAAWTSDPSAPVTVPRVDGPFAFRATNILPRRATSRNLRVAAARDEYGVGELIADRGQVTVMRSLAAKASPNAAAPTAVVVSPGTDVTVRDVVYEGEKSWLQIETAGVQAYLPASERAILAQADLGFSLQEIEVGRMPGGLATLVDDAKLREAVKQLKRQRDISRVSISSPSSYDEAKLSEILGRVAHASLVLEQEGIAGDAITAATADADETEMHEDNIRIRFFGR